MTSPVVPLATAGEVADARRLLAARGLTFEEGYGDLVGIYEEGCLVATAARAGGVLKMFAIDPAQQGGAALGALATELIRLGRAAGEEAFFVFTRPEHAPSFAAVNFRLLATHREAALLEYGGGLAAYLARHAALVRPGRNGASVINGNPFTLGHQHLVETASRQVDTFYLFVVREDRSVFPFVARYRLAAEATRHLPNVVLLDTSRYAVSAATFPTYFLKRLDAVAVAQMQLDARLFAAHLAPFFGIGARYVGREPFDATTAAYNAVMRSVLPEYGVALVEIERRADGEDPISATIVRAALARRDFDALRRMVPETTLDYLRSSEGLALAERLGGATGGGGR
ncbi:MAG: citrate lyase ligase [Gemmatimonadales bacterium]